MSREDALLLLLGAPPKPLDPVRIMKGAFLLTRKYPLLRDAYQFGAYHYGPFSSEVYRDLERLEHRGLVTSCSISGRSWRVYETTEAGCAEVERLDASFPELSELARDLRDRVVSRSFQDLLREVYRDYPEFAVNSLAAGLRRG